MYKRIEPYIRIILLLFWFILVIWGISNHVFWRDEVRALSIAKSASSLFDLPNALENEGHPILWYIFLKIGFWIGNSNLILPLLALLFATANSYLLLFKSPFHWSIAALLIFGQYGLFEYVIVARNYGLSVTFILGFALFATKDKHLLAYVCLALAAQCNFYAMIFSLLLGGYLFVTRFKPNAKFISGAILLLFSALYCYFSCLPTADSLVVRPFSLDAIPWPKIWFAGWGFDNLLDGFWTFKHGFKTILLILTLGLFIRKKWAILTAYAGMIFMAAFHLAIRVNFSQHEGIFLFFIIALAWISYDQIKESILVSNWYRIPVALGILSLVFILFQNTYRGVSNYTLFNRVDQSNADHMGEWLRKEAPDNAVIIAEPDYTLEGVMYYYDQAFFIPRENKFGTFVHFTKANKSLVSLEELISIADSFKNAGKQPLIVSQQDLENTVDTIRYSYGKIFEVDSVAFTNFKNTFEKVADFHEFISTDESFYVYALKSR